MAASTPELICPVCRTPNPATRQFCRKCASDLRAPVRDPNAPVVPPPVEVPIRPIVIGGAVALVIVALVIAALVLLGGSPAASPAPSATLSPTAAPATETPAPIRTDAPATDAPATDAPTLEPGATPQPAPFIRSFVGPESVDRSDPSFDGTIHLTWRVAFADGATLAVDGPGLYKSYTGVAGQENAPFSCGGESHSYTLTTMGGNGPPVSQTLVIGPAN